jgi:hypothetical protein
MSRIKPIITCMWMAITILGFSQEKGWRGIVPLHSTRADVEQMLGAPKESRGVSSTYDTTEGRVLVFYSADRCKEGGANDWNVPRDTVLSITFHPTAKLLVDDLRLDKAKYERVPDFHVQSVVYYFNKEEGIRISARVLEKEGEDMSSITYEPAAKDSYLKCSTSIAPNADANEKEYLIRKFDEYSDLSFEDEKARLDNFAIYLQKNEPKFKSYIIVYAGQRTPSGEAQARAKRAKDYLVKVRGIGSADCHDRRWMSRTVRSRTLRFAKWHVTADTEPTSQGVAWTSLPGLCVLTDESGDDFNNLFLLTTWEL